MGNQDKNYRMSTNTIEINEDVLDKVIQKHIKQEQEFKQFKKERQHQVMEEVYMMLKNNIDFIDDEDVFYNPELYNFSFKEFKWLFNSIMINFKNDSNSYEEYMIYKDMKIVVRKIYGQGICRQMRTDMNFDDEIAFKYEDLFN